MSNDTFKGQLESWIGSQVTIVNPQSYTSTALREGLGFESYTAKLIEISSDCVKLTYSAQRKGKATEVEQWIPLPMIKRISLMGDDKLIHL